MLKRTKQITSTFHPKERVIALGASAVLVLSLAALVWFTIEKTTTVVASRGGRYTEALIGQPVLVNPVLATTETDKALVRLVFNNLFDIAEIIEAKPDKEFRVWRVRIKEGVRWHTGEKLTSDDVIFTVKKIQESQGVSPLFSRFQGVTVQRLSELELQFLTSAPYAFFEETLRNLYVAPKHLFASIPIANWRLSEYTLQPVGSGPYAFVSLEKDRNGFISSYTLKANNDYFRGAPYISHISMRFFTAREAMFEAFDAGEVDGIPGVMRAEVTSLRRPHQLITFPFLNYYAIFLNQSKNQILKEDDVRRALVHATNQAAIAEAVLGPYGHAIENPGTQPLQTPPSADHARQLLDTAGWTMGGDGIRTKNGATLALTLVVPNIQFLVQTAQLLKTQWEPLGISLAIAVRSPQEILETTIKNRDYELLLFGNVLDQNGDLFSFWHSSQRFHPGLNLSIYSNEEVDKLIEAIRQEFDAVERFKLEEELNQEITNDNPALFLFVPDYLYLAAKRLTSTSPPRELTTPGDRFLNIHEWYTETALVFK